jgi:hypothetical protein
MARSRNIKPGFYKNEDLAECSIWARYLYPGLWMLADREGRLEDRPKRIKAELLAFDLIDVEPLLQELENGGFIQRYTSQGVAVILISAFAKHQNPHHREQASELPPPESPGLCGCAMHPEPGVEACMSPKPEALPPFHRGEAVLIPSSQIPFSLTSDSMPTVPHATAGGGGLTESDIWNAGVDILIKANVPVSQARTMLGKLAKDFGKQVTHEAISAAVLEQPVDPRAYLRKTCSAKAERAAVKALRPNSVRAVGFDAHDYTQGITEDGHIC